MTSFIRNPIVDLAVRPINTKQPKCRKYKGFLPNITPALFSLSSNISAPGVYALVYINGQNFTPYNISVTFGTIQNIPIVYYSSFSISFVVPLNLSEGNYSVQVVENNANNLFPGLLYSNKLQYTVQNYVIQGNYSVSASDIFNTILSFLTDSTIVFYNTFNGVWSINGTATVVANGQPLVSGSYVLLPSTVYYIMLGNSGSVQLSLNV
jgi:hypothetical protein